MLACALASWPAIAQQGGATRYVYDDNGRLRAVISLAGEAAVYSYDAAGNITEIRRIAANVITILSFTPRSGAEGDRVQILGTGFGANAASNTVTFNGLAAQVIEADRNRILVTVPAAATTGPITVTSANGTATSDAPFTIAPRIRVTPAEALIPTGTALQFTATPLSAPGVTAFVWSVNGIAGGDASVGTISTTGLYEAPTVPRSVIVRATSATQPDLFGEARATVRDTGRLAVASVSVQRGQLSPSGVVARPVSVQFRNEAGVINALGVTVEFGPRPGRINTAVSAVKGPYISSIAPASLARGATATITITGQDLAGATEVRFLLPSGQPDTSITASSIQVNAAGTQLTAAATVAAAAAVDDRIVTVTATAGRSPSTGLGQNIIRVTQ
ncbi:MAG: IPT/TIG domain-containing protein [Blastocatellia bacterium]